MVVFHASHLVNAGHKVTIKANVLDSVFNVDPRIAFKRLPFAGKVGTLISALLEKTEGDVVLADIIPLTAFLAIRNRRKLVYFAQDYDESYYSSSAAKLIIRMFYHVALKGFRVPVISVSQPLAETLRERFDADVSVVENGVDTSTFFHDPDVEIVALKEHRKALLVLSRHDRRKGFDIAQKIIEHIGKKYHNQFEIWTVGEPCAGIFPNLHHRDFGYIDEENLRKIMSSADIFLYPTRHEGFPLMPLEALACGCPVVTTTAVPYGRNESSIIVAEIEDVDTMAGTITTLIEDDNMLQILKQRAAEFPARYDINVCKCLFEQTLQTISGAC